MWTVEQTCLDFTHLHPMGFALLTGLPTAWWALNTLTLLTIARIAKDGSMGPLKRPITKSILPGEGLPIKLETVATKLE